MIESLIEHHDKLLQRLMKLNEIPQMHTNTVEIAESCVDQIKELMPGSEVRIIITTPYKEAQFEPDRLVGADGVNLICKHHFSETASVTIITEQTA